MQSCGWLSSFSSSNKRVRESDRGSWDSVGNANSKRFIYWPQTKVLARWSLLSKLELHSIASTPPTLSLQMHGLPDLKELFHSY